MKAREYLKNKLWEEVLLYERKVEDLDSKVFNHLLFRWSDDSSNLEEHRYVLLSILVPDIKKKKILDMAAGCGSFVIQGLLNGYNVFGVEPENWKQKLIDIKFEENKYPEEWRNRIKDGVGENLPFEDEFFDVFDSWQTIEHVQDERKCIFELYRVLKKGGCGILTGPNYFCFNEGHYRLFWFPMLDSKFKFARIYLRILGRPLEGLETFHAVNPYKIKRYALEAGFEVVNIKRKQIYDAAKRRLPFLKKRVFSFLLPIIYLLWDIYRGIKNFGIGQRTLSYLLIKR